MATSRKLQRAESLLLSPLPHTLTSPFRAWLSQRMALVTFPTTKPRLPRLRLARAQPLYACGHVSASISLCCQVTSILLPSPHLALHNVCLALQDIQSRHAQRSGDTWARAHPTTTSRRNCGCRGFALVRKVANRISVKKLISTISSR